MVLCLLWITPVLADERFIPLELFTGGEIRKDTEIKFTNANLVFGEKKRKKIVGPENWKNPQTGKTIKVYKRTRKGQSGLKTQLFTVTNDGQCIGRVWDSRKRKLGVVIAIDRGCKFPLGVWKEGETREFFSGYDYPKKRIGMKKKLTIKKIGDEKKCLTFRWVLVPMGGKKSGKIIDDNDYTYCPNKGFTKLVSRK